MPPSEEITSRIRETARMMEAMLTFCASELEEAAGILIKAVSQGKKILWCGNGGSAADAQHMAAELMGGLRDHQRPPIRSLALTTDTSLITAWANDTAFENIFSRQVEGLGETGDVLIAISTSGNSANVLKAVQTAQRKKLTVIALTGQSGGRLKGQGAVTIRIPSEDTQRIQEGHLLAEHILCELLEAALTG